MIPVTYCYPWTADTEDERHAKLKNIADSGIRRLVLTSGLLDKMTADPQLLFSFRNDLKDYGLTFMDGHAPWGTWKDPGMPLEEYHDQVILRHKMAIRFCLDLNVTSLAFHTGNTFNSIFGKFVYPAKNIRLVVCGHICDQPDVWEHGVAFFMDKNSSGKTVAQMAFNTHYMGGGAHGNGGDGWLRLLEFMPDRKTVKATTFSPLFAISPSTWHLAWRHDERSEFTFTIE